MAERHELQEDSIWEMREPCFVQLMLCRHGVDLPERKGGGDVTGNNRD